MDEHYASGSPTCLQRRDLGPPQVFISSTFEPLIKEVRDRLKPELESINLLPMMSELGTFKYTYHGSTVVNDTIQAAATADMFILVVGRRYGTVDAAERSITEQEYEAAQESGIPIFVYVHDEVWKGYGAFRGGAIADEGYSYWVDDRRVFAFINRVTAVDGHRCRPFTSSSEVVDDFRAQIGNLLGGFLRFDSRASSWLWTEEYTREVESFARVVWILTPNFYWDYSDAEFRKLVSDNITVRKTSYYYLYQATDENDRRIKDMVTDYQAALGSDEWRSLVRYAPVPEDEFNWCTEQVMYDPGEARARGVIVDAMEGRDKMNKCNIELGRQKRADFRRQFTQLWYRYGEGELIGADVPRDTLLSEGG